MEVKNNKKRQKSSNCKRVDESTARVIFSFDILLFKVSSTVY